jgi:hypothetical protein
VKPEYISMLSQAQKAAMTTGIERFVTFVGRQMAVDPPPMDNVDFDEAAREYGDMLGVPAKVVRPMREVLEIRRDRAKKEQQQALMQQTPPPWPAPRCSPRPNVGGGQTRCSDDGSARMTRASLPPTRSSTRGARVALVRMRKGQALLRCRDARRALRGAAAAGL